MSQQLYGRRKLHTVQTEITSANVLDVLNKVLGKHSLNAFEEDYLYWYRKGVAPILNRVKNIRPEICNKVHIDNAGPIVSFKNGYFLVEPAFYVSRKDDAETIENVKVLNELLISSGKQSADADMVNNFHTMGVGILYIQPSNEDVYKVYSLDPRTAFVVYSSNPSEEPVMGVYIVRDDETANIDVYTKTRKFTIKGAISDTGDDHTVLINAREVVSEEQNAIGIVPFVEYYYNEARQSAIENILPIADAIDTVESNRIDGIEQSIQSLLVMVNVDLDEGVDANKIRESGMINYTSDSDFPADVRIINQPLDQIQTQTTLNNLYEQLYEKAGVPYTSNKGGGTSDNVGAVYLRNGWASADTCARNTEDLYKKSNRMFDAIVERIVKTKLGIEITSADYEICFKRNSQENLLAKTQAAMNLKSLGLAPEIVLERSGISNDPMNDVEKSKVYIETAYAQKTIPTIGTYVEDPDEKETENGTSAV